MSMMMAMTMMMPMMMNATPEPQPAVVEPVGQASPAASLPDLSKPPPGFAGDSRSTHSRQHIQQSERDREFRSDRSHRLDVPQVPRLDRSPVSLAQDNRRRGRDTDQDEARERGDYWYQRWLSNRNQPTPTQPTVEPWLPSHQPPQLMSLQSPPTFPPTPSGPVPLLPPRGQSHPVERDYYSRSGGAPPPYTSRSNFGARDFSMRKQNQNQRQWD